MKMPKGSKILELVIGTGLALLSGGCPADSSDRLHSMQHDGRTRTYRIHVPASYTGTEPVPLVLALHGGRASSKHMIRWTDFDALADRDGFIVVYPDGLYRRWNDARHGTGHDAPGTRIDDVGFIAALLDHVERGYRIDVKRIYVTGVSNGAMMAHRLACELTDRIAAIAPVIGAMPEPLAAECSSSAPMPVLMINGTDDEFVPWEGGYVHGSETLGRVLSVDDTVGLWVSRNGCATTPAVWWEPDRNPSDGTRVRCDRYGQGSGGSEVILYRVEGGGHTWPGGPQHQAQWLLGTVSRDINSSEIIWQFFQSHSRE